MGCFDKLVKSHFLANVSTELELARRTLQSMGQSFFPASLPASKKARKKVYDNYLFQYYILEELNDMALEEEPHKDMIYYIQIDHVIFVYSRTKKLVTESVMYSYNVNGDLPFYRGKHRIQGYNFHTLLIDTRLSVIPYSPN